MEKMKEEANKANLVHAETILVQDSLEKGISSPTSNDTNQPQQPPGKFRISHSTLITFIKVSIVFLLLVSSLDLFCFNLLFFWLY